MMDTYVDNGEMAPLILFYSGPATWNFVNLLSGFYGTGYTPSFFSDGDSEQIGWTPSACINAINSSLADPSYLAIDASIAGDATSGTVYYNITAEQDLEAVGMIRLISVLVESDVPAGAGWGGYTGQTMRWLPRMSPIGVTGVALSFEGPYPQTISVQGEYTIDSGWDFANMGLVTFVIDYSDKSVFNASYYPDLGDILGIEDAGWGSSCDPVLTVGPNPSNGSFEISAILSGNNTGTVEVFNLAGRIIASGSVAEMQNVSVDESGIYLVRLSTSDGMSVSKSVAVIR